MLEVDAEAEGESDKLDETDGDAVSETAALLDALADAIDDRVELRTAEGVADPVKTLVLDDDNVGRWGDGDIEIKDERVCPTSDCVICVVAV